MSSASPYWFVAALDVLAQHRATRQPLKALAAQIAKARHLGQKDRHLLSEAVFGVSRLSENNDEQIASLLKEKAKISPKKRDIDEVKLFWVMPDSDLIPKRLKEIIETLQASSMEKEQWPVWFEQKIHHVYKNDAKDLLDSLKERAHPVLALDRRHVDLEQLQAALASQGVQSQSSKLVEGALVVLDANFSFAKLPKAMKEHVWLMDEGSQIAALCIAAKPGESVLDLCAGAGVKTRYLMQTGATLTACDTSQKRLFCKPIERVKYVVADGTNPPFKEASMDWILIDAPCSGTGTLRRAPDVLARLKPEELENHVKTQRALVQNAAPLLKKGGHLVYVTCSILPEENQDMLGFIKETLPNLRPVPLQDLWHSKVHVQLEGKTNAIQLLPSKQGCDGFFVAAFERSSA